MSGSRAYNFTVGPTTSAQPAVGTPSLDSDLITKGFADTTYGPSVFSANYINLNTLNGTGSTNTAIMRFTNTVSNTGTGITYADSATDGASFTCTVAGVYSFSMTDSAFSVATDMSGFSLNSNQLTTSISAITLANIIAVWHPQGATTASVYPYSYSVVLPLAVNDVVRPHCNASRTGVGDIQPICIVVRCR